VSEAHKIPLSELLADLRSELADAQKQGAGKEPRFKVEEIELEVKVGITKGVEGETKVKFWVYEAGLEGKASKQNLHRILLKIKPTYSSVSLEVSGETTNPG